MSYLISAMLQFQAPRPISTLVEQDRIKSYGLKFDLLAYLSQRECPPKPTLFTAEP